MIALSRQRLLKSLVAVSAALWLSGTGCLSMQSQTSLDTANAAKGGNQPYVEAYIEYPGPQAKWAGPASYILHVNAKDTGPAQITATPALLSNVPGAAGPRHPNGATAGERNPAASSASLVLSGPFAGAHGAPPVAHPMSSEEARSQLSHLATALQGAQAPFRGCLSPVRVRLVRTDGGLLERQGCRSELGWSRTVSEAVSSFTDATIHGSPLPPAPKEVQAASAPVQAARSLASPHQSQ